MVSLTQIRKLEKIEFGWWVEIVTCLPACSYYFGPFSSIHEAASAQIGYLEDLKQEGAKGIMLRIKQCQPHNLTNFCDQE